MNKIIAFMLVGLASCLHATDPSGPTHISFQTCTQVSISNTTPVELTGNLSRNASAFVSAVKVTNLDATANVCCSQDIAVSCSLGSHHGEVVAPASAAPFNFLAWLVNTQQGWYCINSGGGAVNAEVCLTQ